MGVRAHRPARPYRPAGSWVGLAVSGFEPLREVAGCVALAVLLEHDAQRLAAGEWIAAGKDLQRREDELRLGDRQLSLGDQARAEPRGGRRVAALIGYRPARARSGARRAAGRGGGARGRRR